MPKEENKTILISVGIIAVAIVVSEPPYTRVGEECCLDQNNNGICDKDDPKPDCPNQCCNEGDYKTKQCAYNEECINNICVKKECPHECCDGSIYQVKSCSSGYICVNDKCEEIKIPKLLLSLDACLTSLDIMHGKGEVTDVFGTIQNYGSKEAINVKMSATANDVDDANYIESQGTIGSLPTNYSQKFKLTVDTKSGNQSEVSITASCDECVPKSITSTNANCRVDYEKIENKIQEYIKLGGEILNPVK